MVPCELTEHTIRMRIWERNATLTTHKCRKRLRVFNERRSYGIAQELRTNCVLIACLLAQLVPESTVHYEGEEKLNLEGDFIEICSEIRSGRFELKEIFRSTECSRVTLLAMRYSVRNSHVFLDPKSQYIALLSQSSTCSSRGPSCPVYSHHHWRFDPLMWII